VGPKNIVSHITSLTGSTEGPNITRDVAGKTALLGILGVLRTPFADVDQGLTAGCHVSAACIVTVRVGHCTHMPCIYTLPQYGGISKALRTSYGVIYLVHFLGT
jgi:hypothetical protein